MIKIESLTIKEFRGIRDLTLDLDGKNFAVCGPNGTGKSGIVDALEFVLTGNISRLSGEGRGEISVKQHAPHVDKRNDPDKARVSAKITIPSLKKTVVVERSAKAPAAIQVTPAEPEVLEVLRLLESRREVVLSRRELIRYVLATPGKRAEEIQALLHLDRVDKIRGLLQRIANSSERQLGPLATARANAASNLLRAVEVPELTKEKLLAAANAKRATLGLPELAELTKTTSLKDGMAAAKADQLQRIPKAQATAEISVAREALGDFISMHLAIATERHLYSYEAGASAISSYRETKQQDYNVAINIAIAIKLA
jgi:DNA repair exonuclease SbcCD ATPase subunit